MERKLFSHCLFYRNAEVDFALTRRLFTRTASLGWSVDRLEEIGRTQPLVHEFRNENSRWNIFINHYECVFFFYLEREFEARTVFFFFKRTSENVIEDFFFFLLFCTAWHTRRFWNLKAFAKNETTFFSYEYSPRILKRSNHTPGQKPPLRVAAACVSDIDQPTNQPRWLCAGTVVCWHRFPGNWGERNCRRLKVRTPPEKQAFLSWAICNENA